MRKEREHAYRDEEIREAMEADPDFPDISGEDLRQAVAISASGRVKRPISIRLDEEVLEYFQSAGPKYQTKINDVLLGYVRAHCVIAAQRARKSSTR